MMKRHRLHQQIAELRTLARFQRSVRLGLRALWLGAGGIMLGWGLHTIWGVLPSTIAWVLIGLALAAWPLGMLAASFKPQMKWVQHMDRRLGLQEQISTAWEVVQTKQRNLVSNLLVRDAMDVLPRLQQRVLRRGWNLEIDLYAAMIILLLAAMLLGARLIRPYRDLLGGPPVANIPQVLPPPQVPQDQSNQSQEQQPGGEEGAGEGGGQEGQQQPGAEGQDPGQEPGPGEDPGEGAGAAAEALQQMGEDLSQQAGTYDLGQELQELDLNGAAEALEDLQNNLDDLSPESRENLEEALREAAEALEQAGEPDLGQNMQEAAEALEEENDAGAGEAMGEMADNLRDMAGEMETAGPGEGAGEGQSAGTGGPEPLARLQNEGGELNLPSGDATDSGLLNPSDPNASGEGTASGSQDSTLSPTDETTVQSPLLPSSFLWKWRDVVSQYFQR